MFWHETKIRVRYAETDQMGVVHHSNHIVWFEAGRSDFCRAKGFSYSEMEDDGINLVVAEVYCRYKSPAFYDEDLSILTRIQDLKNRSLKFVYEIRRPQDNKLIAEGETLHVITNKEMKVCSLPDKYRKILSPDENLLA